MLSTVCLHLRSGKRINNNIGVVMPDGGLEIFWEMVVLSQAWMFFAKVSKCNMSINYLPCCWMMPFSTVYKLFASRFTLFEVYLRSHLNVYCDFWTIPFERWSPLPSWTQPFPVHQAYPAIQHNPVLFILFCPDQSVSGIFKIPAVWCLAAL